VRALQPLLPHPQVEELGLSVEEYRDIHAEQWASLLLSLFPARVKELVDRLLTRVVVEDDGRVVIEGPGNVPLSDGEKPGFSRS
jgi:hypothetical protein